MLLSDIRLNSPNQVAAVNSLTKQIEFNGYDFYHNSVYASRGVGILVKKQLSFRVEELRRDRQFSDKNFQRRY
jgi:hypothetical protein